MDANCTRSLSRRIASPVLGTGVRAISVSAPVFGTKHLDWYQNALRRQEELKTHVEPPPYPAEPLHGRKRARAFIDFQIGKAEEGGDAAPTQRVVLELADDIVPNTVTNFLNVSIGIRQPLSCC